jgi:hypothetical protein
VDIISAFYSKDWSSNPCGGRIIHIAFILQDLVKEYKNIKMTKISKKIWDIHWLFLLHVHGFVDIVLGSYMGVSSSNTAEIREIGLTSALSLFIEKSSSSSRFRLFGALLFPFSSSHTSLWWSSKCLHWFGVFLQEPTVLQITQTQLTFILFHFLEILP